jgi:hypothetical protein
MKLRWQLNWLVIAALAWPAQAAMMQRCTDAEGALTFTHTTCPDGLTGEPHWAYNPPPGSIAPSPPARAVAARPQVARPEAHPGERTLPEKKTKTLRKAKKPAKYVPWRP